MDLRSFSGIVPPLSRWTTPEACAKIIAGLPPTQNYPREGSHHRIFSFSAAVMRPGSNFKAMIMSPILLCKVRKLGKTDTEVHRSHPLPIGFRVRCTHCGHLHLLIMPVTGCIIYRRVSTCCSTSSSQHTFLLRRNTENTTCTTNMAFLLHFLHIIINYV